MFFVEHFKPGFDLWVNTLPRRILRSAADLNRSPLSFLCMLRDERAIEVYGFQCIHFYIFRKVGSSARQSQVVKAQILVVHAMLFVQGTYTNMVLTKRYHVTPFSRGQLLVKIMNKPTIPFEWPNIGLADVIKWEIQDWSCALLYVVQTLCSKQVVL